MAKNKTLKDSPIENALAQSDQQMSAKVVTSDKNNNNNNKPNKGKKDANKKENFFIRIPKRIGRAFVGMWKEMKTVTWPSFGKAMASTGVVIAVVCIFFLVLLAIDSGLGALFNVVIGK